MNWRDLVLENRWQKLFALGLAVMIWFTARPTEGVGILDDASDGTRTISNVSIVVLTTAVDLGRYTVSPATVKIELRGDPDVLRQMSPGSIEAYVNLVDLGATPQTLMIHVNPPLGTELVSISPVKVLVNRIIENPPSPPPP